MPDYMVRWLYRQVVRQALAGRFWPAVSAYGGAGVWVWHTWPDAEMEFQWDEMDGDAVWKVCGQTVACFKGGRLVT